MEQTWGEVNVEGKGIIIVPGRTEAERVNYARNLFNNMGVFIPTFGCDNVIIYQEESDMTFGIFQRNATDPIIAVGTLNDYKCFDAMNFDVNVLYDPIFSLLTYDMARKLLMLESYTIRIIKIITIVSNNYLLYFTTGIMLFHMRFIIL